MSRALFFALCSALALMPPALHAQRISVTGRGDAHNDVFLRDVLQRADLVVLSRDTILGRTDTIAGTVLVVAATARIDGVIAGDLVVVDGNVFLRPNARVLGSVRNISGGLYPSERAVVSDGIRSQPNAPYRADVRDDGSIVIRGTAEQSLILFDGVYGITPPTYDRVDGLSARFGAGLLLPRIELIEPVLRGHVDYRSQRGDITGGGELALRRGGTEISGGVERTTLTNERWIRKDLVNSLAFLAQGKDYRDYYEVDRAYAEIQRTFEAGARTTTAFVRGQVEEARSLAAGSPWTLFGTPREDNLPVAEDRIASITAGLHMNWSHPQHVIALDGAVEVAGDVLDGDHAFNRYLVDSQWEMAGFGEQTLALNLHFQGPLPGPSSLPPQRWSFVGGSGTLYTFAVAQFRGDRVAYAQTTYSIPLPTRFRMRVVGLPSLELLHMIGMAWTDEQAQRFRQNIGVRLRYNVVFVRVVTDPEHFGDDIELAVGLTMPQKARPWQTPR